MVNIEITQKDDFGKGKGRKNLFQFGVEIVEECIIVGRVRGEINTADEFSTRVAREAKP